MSLFSFLIGGFWPALRAMPAGAIQAMRLCIGAVRRTVPKSTQGSRRGALLATLVLALGVILAMASLAHTGEAPLALHRGLNLEVWQNGTAPAPGGDRGARDFAQLNALGFDFVRLPVDSFPLLSAEGDRRREAMDRLERAVRLMRKSGLKVVLSLRPAKLSLPTALPNVTDRDRALVADLAGMLMRVDADATALELTSEVDLRSCDAPAGRAWEAQVEGMVGAARDTARDLTLVVSGACGGNAKGLVQLNPTALNDDRLLFSFNFFEPTGFTLQGIGAAKDIKGVPWPADAVAKPMALVLSKLLISRDQNLTSNQRERRLSDVRRHLDGYLAGGWEELRLKARFGEVRTWAERHHLPSTRLLLGSFGVMAANQNRGGALDADRFRWLSAVRLEAEALGAAWTYSPSSFDEDRHPDPIALTALGFAPGVGN